MTLTRTARPTARRARIHKTRAGVLLALAAVAAVSSYQSLASSPTATTSPPNTLRSENRERPHRPPRLRSAQGARLGDGDGPLPEGATVFDDELPGVANLDPALLAALRRATIDAAADGVELEITSGWRSPEYQDRLLREAVSEHGSEAEAARWVATAQTSPHVSGDAVDLGESGAREWLAERGSAYGLCQIYGNEPWHYELRPTAGQRGCPPMYPDPTHDPRMRP